MKEGTPSEIPYLRRPGRGRNRRSGRVGSVCAATQVHNTTDHPESETAFRFLSTLQQRYIIDSRHALKREQDFRRPCCVENLSTVEAITSSNPFLHTRAAARASRTGGDAAPVESPDRGGGGPGTSPPTPRCTHFFQSLMLQLRTFSPAATKMASNPQQSHDFYTLRGGRTAASARQSVGESVAKCR